MINSLSELLPFIFSINYWSNQPSSTVLEFNIISEYQLQFKKNKK